MAPWADVLYAADGYWWLENAPHEAEFRGLRFVGEAIEDGSGIKVSGPVPIPVRGDLHTLVFRREYIGSGENGGFQALNLALRWGARTVLLTGVDCTGTHWHGRHGGSLRNADQRCMNKWLAHWESAAKQLRGWSVPVINCSRVSLIEGFPRMELADALEDALGPGGIAAA